MGKGQIISGGTDGQYNVKLLLSRNRVDEAISYIDDRIVELNDQIALMPEGAEKNLTILKRTSYEKQKEYLNDNMPKDPTVSAWCIDLTEDLSGEVGTIEVPGERGEVNIQAGYEGSSNYDQVRDGQLEPSIAGTPAGTFYNLAMLPGWQKWKPTYRYGTISNINTEADTCKVTLDAAMSSQQGLDVNQETVLTGVDIDYMSCNSAAFENGDEVVVKFNDQDFTKPKVIGFKDSPKACEFYLRMTFNGHSPALGGEKIELENDETSEQRITAVGGLCGPFTGDVNTGSETIKVFYEATVVNPNYSDKWLFRHWEEVDEGEATNHFGVLFSDYYGQKEFGVLYYTGTILHARIVEWLLHTKILSECIKTSEEIEGSTYLVYEVDFTELYFVGLTKTLKLENCGLDCDRGCGYLSKETPEVTNYLMEYIGSVPATHPVYAEICQGYAEICEEDPPSCKAVYFSGAENVFPSPFSVNSNQFCVLGDSNGQNVSYAPLTLDANGRVIESEISYGLADPPIIVCNIQNTNYSGFQEYKHELTLAPANKF